MNLRQNLEASTVSTEALSMRLRALSPKDTLRRGYAIVQTVDESTVVSDPGQVSVGDGIEITLAKGKNILRFTHEGGKGTTIKDFTLKRK